jgi:MATE family multidrug resistance protein
MVPESFLMGTLSVVNTYVSQNLGASRPEKCSQYAWAGMMVALIGAALAAPLALLAGPIFAFYGHDPQTQMLEATYFRYVMSAILLTLPSRVLEGFFFGIGRPGIVLTASIIANVCNLALNWLLVFGRYGLPRMELAGSALASVISWGLQLAILLAVYLSPAMNRRFGTWKPLAFTWKQCTEILRVGAPAGVTFCNDILSWTVFMGVLVGRFGTVHLTATAAVFRYLPLSFMPAVGISIATTVLVGRYIGEGRPDLAAKRTHAGLIASMVYMSLCGLAFFIWRHELIRAFVYAGDTDPAAVEAGAEVIAVGGMLMILSAVFQLFDAIGIVFIAALRGAGDTRWTMAITVLLSWGVIIGGGTAVVFLLPGLASVGPWLAATAYVIVMSFFVALRFERGEWKNLDLLGKRKA